MTTNETMHDEVLSEHQRTAKFIYEAVKYYEREAVLQHRKGNLDEAIVELQKANAEWQKLAPHLAAIAAASLKES